MKFVTPGYSKEGATVKRLPIPARVATPEPQMEHVGKCTIGAFLATCAPITPAWDYWDFWDIWLSASVHARGY
jgi:hypothetical protein